MQKFAVLCLLLVCALLSGNARAGHVHGISSAPVIPGISRRAVVNMNTAQNNPDYLTINLIQMAPTTIGPWSTTWSSGTIWSSAVLDPQGWPCWNPASPPAGTTCTNTSGSNNPAQGRGFGGGYWVPASANFAGPYCYQGYGTGVVNINANAGGVTFTAASGQKCATFSASLNCDGTSQGGSGTASISTSILTVTDESWTGWCIALTLSGSLNDLGFDVTSDDPNNTGHYFKGFQIYQQPDGADLAGTGLCTPNPCIFRAAAKQTYLNYDPSYVRMVNWAAATLGADMNFTKRMTPLNAIGYGGNGASFTTQFLPYQASSGTYALTVSGVTGTPTNMTQGEVAQFRVGTTTTGGGEPQISALSIPISGTVQITTGGTFPFANGDTIIICISNCLPTTSTNKILNLFPVTVASGGGTNTITFSFANTAGLTACSGNCSAIAAEFFTLQVGSGGNRTAYPMVNNQGAAPFSIFSNLTAGNLTNFCFNKNYVGQWDGAGNPVTGGVWMQCNGYGIPIELMVAWINELNAMSPAHTINLWYQVPPTALICNTFYCDADTTSTNEWPANAVDVIMNPGSTSRAKGYSELKSPAQLIVEGGNELWCGSVGGSQDIAKWAYYRYLGSNAPNDCYFGSTLWSAWVVRDIKQSSVYSSYGSRIHFIRTGQAVAGGATSTGNAESIMGNSNVGTYVLPDAAYPLGSSGANAPILDYDYGFAVAPYIYTTNATYNSNVCSTNTYSPCTGTPGTIVAQWVTDVQSANASGTANGFLGSAAIADIASWAGPSGLLTTDSGQSSISSSETEMTSLASLLSSQTLNNNGNPYNSTISNYEGGSLNYPWVNPNRITAISCAAGTASFTVGNSYASGDNVVVNDVSVAGYNSIVSVSATGLSSSGFQTTSYVTCPSGTPTASYQGGYGYSTNLNNGFLIAGVTSTGWGTAMVNFFNTFTGNMYMPSTYVLIQGGEWAMAFPDTFGAGSNENTGVFPIWTSIGTRNQALTPYLLNRDLDPASNDFSPAFLDMAA